MMCIIIILVAIDTLMVATNTVSSNFFLMKETQINFSTDSK